MKRLLMVTLFLVVAPVPTYASIACYSYPNTVSWDDGDVDFCYSTGGVCVECVDVARGKGCAVNYSVCDPDRAMVPRMLLAQMPTKSMGRAQVAASRQGHSSRTGHSGSIRPVAVRVARLNAGNLL